MTFCACMGQAVRAGPRTWPGLCCYPALASGSSAQAGKRRSAPGAVVFGSPSAVIRDLPFVCCFVRRTLSAAIVGVMLPGILMCPAQ
jgi:hypothetical protein